VNWISDLAAAVGGIPKRMNNGVLRAPKPIPPSLSIMLTQEQKDKSGIKKSTA
jgi:hypothetical protein